MMVTITNSENETREYKALALAVNDVHGLVSIDIGENIIPVTCSQESLPSLVIECLERGLKAKDMRVGFAGTVNKVGKCSSNENPDEVLFCILDDDSLFKNFTVDQAMLKSLENDMVMYKRTKQSAGKPICKFFYGIHNFERGRTLSVNKVLHIEAFEPGRFTQGNPELVHELAQLAKTYFMRDSRTKKDVLETLEKAVRDVGPIDKSLKHAQAVQVALGGSVSDLGKIGRFVKCPTQVNRAKKNGGKMCWSETPCCCNLTEIDGCPQSKETQRVIGRRKKAHGRKEEEQKKRQQS